MGNGRAAFAKIHTAPFARIDDPPYMAIVRKENTDPQAAGGIPPSSQPPAFLQARHSFPNPVASARLPELELRYSPAGSDAETPLHADLFNDGDVPIEDDGEVNSPVAQDHINDEDASPPVVQDQDNEADKNFSAAQVDEHVQVETPADTEPQIV